MQTITKNSFTEVSQFITDNPTYQINDINVVSETEIIITYTIPA
jgi:hypothetical protein